MKRLAVVLAVLVIGLVAVGASFVRTPYLGFTSDTATEVVVSWKTDTPVAATIYYDTDTAFSAIGHLTTTVDVAADQGEGNVYHVTLTGLKPNTRYAYQVVLAGGPASEIGKFWTASKDLTEFVFDVYGDTRTFPKRHRLVVSAMAEDSPRFVVHTGDLVENGGVEDQWDSNFFWAIAPLAKDSPYLTVLGNHENNADEYYQALALPPGGGDYGKEWWSVDYGPVHLVGLDTNALLLPNGFSRMMSQISWLKQDLAAAKARGEKFIFVFFHHPLFSSSAGYYPGNESLRSIWHPIFVKYHVTAVFSGHTHSYERLNEDGITYVVTGGGGAPLGGFRYEPVPGSIKRLPLLHYVRVTIGGDTAKLEMIPVASVEGEEVNELPHRPLDEVTINVAP